MSFSPDLLILSSFASRSLLPEGCIPGEGLWSTFLGLNDLLLSSDFGVELRRARLDGGDRRLLSPPGLIGAVSILLENFEGRRRLGEKLSRCGDLDLLRPLGDLPLGDLDRPR